MVIIQYTKTLYPATLQGTQMANEMAHILKEQGCFLSRNMDTNYIIIEAKYRFVVEEQTGENRNENN